MIHDIALVSLGVFIGICYFVYRGSYGMIVYVVKGELPEGVDRMIEDTRQKLDETGIVSIKFLRYLRLAILIVSPILAIYFGFRLLLGKKKGARDREVQERVLGSDGFYHWVFKSIYWIPKNFPYDIAREDGFWRIRDKVGNLAIDKPIVQGDEIVWNDEGELFIY